MTTKCILALAGGVLAAGLLGSGPGIAAGPDLPEVLDVIAVEGEELCFEASPRINWQKTAQRYFTDFPIYRPPPPRVRAAWDERTLRAKFRYPAELPFPKGYQRYFVLSRTDIQEIVPRRAVGTITYQSDREAKDVHGPYLTGEICGPASKKGSIVGDPVFVLATRPSATVERVESTLAPFAEGGYELSAAGRKWRFYQADLRATALGRGYTVRVTPEHKLFLVVEFEPEPGTSSASCALNLRIYELAAQPILRDNRALRCP